MSSLAFLQSKTISKKSIAEQRSRISKRLHNALDGAEIFQRYTPSLKYLDYFRSLLIAQAKLIELRTLEYKISNAHFFSYC